MRTAIVMEGRFWGRDAEGKYQALDVLYHDPDLCVLDISGLHRGL